MVSFKIKSLISAVAFIVLANSSFAKDVDKKVQIAIEDGLRYLESVQTEYGEFPTIFTPNLPEPERSLRTTYDINLFTTVMLSDALHDIKDARVERMQKKVVSLIQSQLSNDYGLWSYFTTHNPNPLYPISIYDLDDTAFASMVLQQNNISFPGNRAAINANKNEDGVYKTFVFPAGVKNNIDCGVNANVLSYLQDNNPQVCNYLNEQVASGKNCATYYTQPLKLMI